MEIPSLVRTRLGDEDIETAVSLGGEDVVCFTPSRTLLYRGEGLLSDEGVEVFSHDVERLGLSEGRRKTEFTLEYVDGSDAFAVPSDSTRPVLERLVDGVLTTAGITDPDEAVAGVFRFSELTLVVTDRRVVKHVGTPVWDADYEEYPFDEVTGLDFEDGSVATSVVLSVDGRPERIKAPNDQAPKVRQTLQNALFAYHGVDSLAALNEKVGPDEDTDGEDDSELTMDEGISPLVGEGSDGSGEADEGAGAERRGRGDAGNEAAASTGSGADSAGSSHDDSAARTEAGSADAGQVTDTRSGAADRADGDGTRRGGGIDPEEFAQLRSEVTQLREAVARQNEILERQRETVDQLIQELRQGR